MWPTDTLFTFGLVGKSLATHDTLFLVVYKFNALCIQCLLQFGEVDV